MKKLLFVLFTILSFNLASSQNFTVNGINYSVITGTTNVKVDQGQCYTGALILPSTVSYNSINYSVTSIENQAFFNCSNLTSLNIPDSVTFIGDAAFAYCSSLTSLSIPNSVTSIENNVFAYCPNITSLSIPNSVTSIGNSAFYNCSSLTSLNIPNSVTSIGYSAFNNCLNLTSLSISNSVTFIRDRAFGNCSSLTNLTLPNSINVIENFAFTGCTNLTSLNIPNSVTYIGFEAFSFCSSLTTLTIGNSVTYIGYKAFYNCQSLTSVICDIVNPLVISFSDFGNANYSTCSLTVPPASLSAYQNAPVWQNFYSINGVLETTNFVIKDNLQLYPNPTKNELFIDVKNLTNTKLDVLNINGKILFNQPLNVTNTIDTSNLSNGMYLFKITSDEGSLTTKVIKN